MSKAKTYKAFESNNHFRVSHYVFMFMLSCKKNILLTRVSVLLFTDNVIFLHSH